MASSLAKQVTSHIRGQLAILQIPQTELAARLGVSQAAVSRRVNGKARWDLDDLPVIADCLGLTVSELLERCAA